MTQSSPNTFVNPHTVRQLFVARWFPGVRLFPCTALRLAGMLPVVLVLIIHALAYITVVPGTLLPLLSSFPYSGSALLLFFHLVFISTVANYLLLVLIDPGSVPEDWKAPPPPTFFHARHIPRQRPVLPPTHTQSTPPAPNAQLQAPVTSESNPVVQEPPEASSSTHFPIDLAAAATSITPSATNTSLQKTFNNFRYSHLMNERTYEGYLRYCRICKAYKPDRSHHCSVCRRCILRMDHHCVFVNNCVSFYNHKFFVSFVTYAFIGCIIVSVLSFPTFADIVSVPEARVAKTPALLKVFMASKWNHLGTALRANWNKAVRTINPSASRMSLTHLSAAPHLPSFMKTLVMVGYITSGAFAFALGIFVALHLYLAAKGRTTIEMYELTDPVRAPLVAQYDLGVRQNIRKVCGNVPLCWFFPTRAFIEGDGLSYERKQTSLGHNAV